MDYLWKTGYRAEIERCSNMYRHFKDGAGYIRAVFEGLESYFDQSDQNLPIQNMLQVAPDETLNTTDLMKKDSSLRLQPPVNQQLFIDLFRLSCEQTVKSNPNLEQIMEQVTGKVEEFIYHSEEELHLHTLKLLMASLVKETSIGQDMATFLFSIILSSIYRQQFENIRKVVRIDLYEGGDCPLCGERPHYGYLRQDDGAKVLDCWLCGTQWAHNRVKCPYCNNEEREELGYFTVEGIDVCRVNYCHRCRQYCKIIDARNFNLDSSLILAIHNLASLGHDLLARKEGFSAGSGLEWVNEEELSER